MKMLEAVMETTQVGLLMKQRDVIRTETALPEKDLENRNTRFDSNPIATDTFSGSFLFSTDLTAN